MVRDFLCHCHASHLPIPLPIFALLIQPLLVQIFLHTFHAPLKQPGTQLYKIWLSDTNFCVCSAKASTSVPANSLTGMPKEYYDFANVFSKQKAQELSDHCPYNMKIKLEEGMIPPSPGHLYSLSALEQQTLQTFIQDNLNFGFICPSKFSHRAPVLFTKK